MRRALEHKVKATKENILGDFKAYCRWRYELGNNLIHSKLHSLHKILNHLPADLHKYHTVIAKGNSRGINYYWCSEDNYSLDEI